MSCTACDLRVLSTQQAMGNEDSAYLFAAAEAVPARLSWIVRRKSRNPQQVPLGITIDV
jgi:hypothetical protein